MSTITTAGPGVVPSELAVGAEAVRRARARRSRRRLQIVAVVLVAALGFLLYKALTSAFVYFKTVGEAVSSRAELGTSTFQLEGVVVPGSVHRRGADSLYFTISSGSANGSSGSANGSSGSAGVAEVAVHDTGVPPQLFQADIPVVLVGHFVGSSDTFASSQILVKHSNEYIAAHPDRVKGPTGKVVR